jgi:hypothetical protein
MDPAELIELGALWQERVRHLLLGLAHDPGVFVIRRVERHVRATSPQFIVREVTPRR